jgi:hypothetical protein
MNLSEMLDTGIGPMAIMLVGLVVILAILYNVYRTMYPAEIRNGVGAEAKILKVWDTGTTINDNPQIGLLLEARPPAGPVFQAETKTLVSRLNAALIQPGITAAVVYDPQKPARVQVREIRAGTPESPGAVRRMEELEQLRERRLISDANTRKSGKTFSGTCNPSAADLPSRETATLDRRFSRFLIPAHAGQPAADLRRPARGRHHGIGLLHPLGLFSSF